MGLATSWTTDPQDPRNAKRADAAWCIVHGWTCVVCTLVTKTPGADRPHAVARRSRGLQPGRGEDRAPSSSGERCATAPLRQGASVQRGFAALPQRSQIDVHCTPRKSDGQGPQVIASLHPAALALSPGARYLFTWRDDQVSRCQIRSERGTGRPRWTWEEP